jgi:hypothetical protein
MIRYSSLEFLPFGKLLYSNILETYFKMIPSFRFVFRLFGFETIADLSKIIIMPPANEISIVLISLT